MMTRIRRLLQSGPVDLTTPEGRSKERYRRVALTSAASALAKGVSAITGLVSVPLTLHFLGSERYGLWITISSVVAFLGFSDLGINNGLLNGISKAHGTDNRTLAKEYVSSAFFFLTAIALLLGFAFMAAYPWIPWPAVFNVKSPQAIADSGPAAAAFVLCFLLSIPAGIVSRIQLGYQEGFSANLWSSAGNILALGAIILVVKLRSTLPILVVAIAGAPILAMLLNGVIFFCRKRPWLLPAWSSVRRDVSTELLRSGGFFFLLQLAMAIGFSTDNIVLAQVMGPDAVTQYSVPAKLFNLIAVLISFISMSLWPAYSEALVRKDHVWVRKTLRRTLLTFGATSAILSGLLLTFGPQIMHVWVGRKLQTPLLLMVGLAIWSVVLALSTPISVFLNAANIVGFQVLVSCGSAMANILLSIYLTHTIGVSGVVFGSIITQFLLVLIPYGFYMQHYLRTLLEPGRPVINDSCALTQTTL